MTEHPENEEWMNKLIKEVESIRTVDVWCKGCMEFRKMNGEYAKYLDGEIENCGKCRQSKG